MKYAWIDRERKAYPLPVMCKTLAVSISGYRAWKRGGSPNRKRLTDAQLLAAIGAIHAELKGPMDRRESAKRFGGVDFRSARSGLSG